MTIAELVKAVDEFVEKHQPPGVKSVAGGMREDLLRVVQRAVDYGEGKEQSKISGIAFKLIKMLGGGLRE